MRRLLFCLVLSVSSLPPTASSGEAVDAAALRPTSDLALRLKAHVDRLAAPELQGREPGTEGNRAAARYVIRVYEDQGLRPFDSLAGFRQEITSDIGDNLIGVRPPVDSTVPTVPTVPIAGAPFILVGAHYDHLGNGYLGADDNASGVAIMLEVARLLGQLRHHAVLFVAFNAEERPYIRTPLMGSQHFADHLPAEVGATAAIKVAVIMDLMGGVYWEPLRQVVFAAGAEKAPVLYRRLKESVRTERDAAGRGDLRGRAVEPVAVVPLGIHLVEHLPVIGQVSFSDYDAFRDAGVPFLFLSSGRTPRYHTEADLPDTLHYERMAATVRFLARFLHHIDADAGRYAVEPDRVEVEDEVAALRPLVALAADPGSQIPGTSWLSRWRLEQDRDWLRDLDPASAGAEAITRLERVSIRLQCLLADFPACFLF